jgi:hypothetical protein
LAFLGFANGVSLWTIRNYRAFHDVIPVVDSAPYHVWLGNNPKTTGGWMPPETALEALAESRGQDKKVVLDELAGLKQPQRYRQLGRDVKKEIERDPAGFFRHRLEALTSFFFGEQWFKDRLLWQTRPAAATKMPQWLEQCYPAILYGSLLAMLILGVLGWRWSYAWSYAANPSSLALIWITLPYVITHAALLSGPRLPLDGIFLCYAGLAITCLLFPLRSPSGGDRPGP